MPGTDIEAVAAELVCAVHDNDRATCHRILLETSQDDFRALAVVLAASVRTEDPLLAAYTTTLPYEDIADGVCRALDLEPTRFRDDMTVPYRQGRHIAAWIGASVGYSQSAYGRHAGRHHVTIGSSVRKVAQDPQLLRVADAILADLTRHDERRRIAA